MQAKAQARYVRVTPQKARRVLNLIRGLPTGEASMVLRFSPQNVSDQINKVLASAVANAANNQGVDPRNLVVSEAFVDEGPTMKRFRPRAQGRGYRIDKRTCHITVMVEPEDEVKPRPSIPKRRVLALAPKPAVKAPRATGAKPATGVVEANPSSLGEAQPQAVKKVTSAKSPTPAAKKSASKKSATTAKKTTTKKATSTKTASASAKTKPTTGKPVGDKPAKDGGK